MDLRKHEHSEESMKAKEAIATDILTMNKALMEDRIKAEDLPF